jgi:hypothetical protein
MFPKIEKTAFCDFLRQPVPEANIKLDFWPTGIIIDLQLFLLRPPLAFPYLPICSMVLEYLPSFALAQNHPVL